MKKKITFSQTFFLLYALLTSLFINSSHCENHRNFVPEVLIPYRD